MAPIAEVIATVVPAHVPRRRSPSASDGARPVGAATGSPGSPSLTLTV